MRKSTPDRDDAAKPVQWKRQAGIARRSAGERLAGGEREQQRGSWDATSSDGRRLQAEVRERAVEDEAVLALDRIDRHAGAEPGLVQVLAAEHARSELAPEILREMYQTMVLVRVLDRRMVTLQRQGRIAFYVPSIGEEAAQIGSAAALQREDWVFSAYREQGAALYRGYPLDKLLCQTFGVAEDYSKGRQMPDHFGTPRIRYTCASSPVGTQLPHAVGAAWGLQLRGEDAVALAYFGDGATSTGDFHAGMNLAGVRRLPVVFFCKNNGWAISLPRERQTASPTLAMKAEAYGFDGVRVDGNDLLAVHQVTAEALRQAREGGGPTMIEAVTYRMGPHSTSDDPRLYRDPALVEEWQRRDPIMRMRGYLEAIEEWTPEREEAAWAEAERRVQEAIDYVETLPPPALETIVEDVYESVPWHLREQLAELQALAGEAE